jgi:hypothetical protein
MIDSPGVAAWIAQIGFWALLVLGCAFGELRLRGALIFLGVWIAALVGLPHMRFGAELFAPVIAILDIVLVLVIFKGDVRLR